MKKKAIAVLMIVVMLSLASMSFGEMEFPGPKDWEEPDTVVRISYR